MKKHDRGFILALDEPLPLTGRPFETAARKAGLTEKTLLAKLRGMKKRGTVRRVGAILNHRDVGLKENVLTAWKADKNGLRKAAETIAGFPNVSHCYERKSYPSWPYNLYAMIHGKNRKDCLSTVKKIAAETGLKQKKILFTGKELKKTKTSLKEILFPNSPE